MKTNMRKLVVTSFVFGLSGLASAASTTTVGWQAVEGVLDGNITNAAHWAGGAVPGALQQAYPSVSGTYTMTFPNGDYASLASWRLRAQKGYTVTWDGAGSRFHAALPTASNYNGEPFGFISSGGGHMFNFEYSGGSVKSGTGLGANDWVPPYGFEDFHVRLIGKNSVSELHFDKGTFNFYDPLGTCYYGNLPRIVFFYNAPNNISGDWEEIFFHSGTVTRLPNIQWRGKSSKNRVTYAGGEHTVFGSLTSPTGEGGNSYPQYQQELFVTNGALLLVQGSIYLGNVEKHCTNRTFSVFVSDSGRITTPVISQDYGRVNLNIGSGGTIDAAVSLAKYASATGSVAMAEGATLNTSGIYGATATSCALFRSDGGTLRATKATTSFFYNFAEAALGTKGLAIDSDYDVTLAQNFTNATDEATGALLAGKLVKTGIGTLTLTGRDSTFAALNVNNGALVLADNAKVRTSLTVRGGSLVTLAADNGLTALVLGDAASFGRLALKPAVTVAVHGPVAIANARLALNGSFALGATYTVLTATGDCSAAQAAWANLKVLEGYAEGQRYVLTSDVADGVTSFKLTVEASEMHDKIVTTDETATEPIRHSPYDTLNVTVSDAATYEVPTVLETGVLVKKGIGEMKVAADLLSVYLAIELQSGTLAFTNVTAVATPLLEMPFSVNGDASGATVIRTDSDITVADMSVVSGAWIKHGPGELTVLNEGAQTKKLTKCSGSVAQEGSLGAGVVRLEPGKAPPASGFSGMSVAEGTLRFKGTGVSSVFDLQNSVSVGMVTPDVHEGAQPRLVVDNCTVKTCASGYHFLFASDLKGDNAKSYAGCSPEIIVTNKAVLTSDALTTCKNGDTGACGEPKMLVDDATYYSSYRVYCSLVNAPLFHPTYTVRNKGRFIERFSKLYPDNARANSGFCCYGPTTFIVNDSILASEISATGTDYDGISLLASGNNADCFFSFSNKAVFWCRRVATASSLKRLSLVFDDATWEFGCGTNLCVEHPAAVRIDVRSGGLTLHATTAKPLQVNQPFAGPGVLTKTGSATLWFDARSKWQDDAIVPCADDAVTLACDVTVSEGELAVSPCAASGTNLVTLAAGTTLDLRGQTVGGLVLAGEGTVRNGTLSKAVLRVAPQGSDAVITLSSDVTCKDCLVDLGTNVEVPYPQGLLVAKYAGAAPQVAGWKVLRRADSTKLRGNFTAADGEVRVDVCRSGLMMIVK